MIYIISNSENSTKTYIQLFLYKRKLRSRIRTSTCLGLTANKWQNWDSNPLLSVEKRITAFLQSYVWIFIIVSLEIKIRYI